MIKVYTMVVDVDVDEERKEGDWVSTEISDAIRTHFDEQLGLNCLVCEMEDITPRIPGSATFYTGRLDQEEHTFYKTIEIGVAGTHWFRWTGSSWVMYGHTAPHGVKRIGDFE